MTSFVIQIHNDFDEYIIHAWVSGPEHSLLPWVSRVWKGECNQLCILFNIIINIRYTGNKLLPTKMKSHQKLYTRVTSEGD